MSFVGVLLNSCFMQFIRQMLILVLDIRFNFEYNIMNVEHLVDSECLVNEPMGFRVQKQIKKILSNGMSHSLRVAELVPSFRNLSFVSRRILRVSKVILTTNFHPSSDSYVENATYTLKDLFTKTTIIIEFRCLLIKLFMGKDVDFLIQWFEFMKLLVYRTLPCSSSYGENEDH